MIVARLSFALTCANPTYQVVVALVSTRMPAQSTYHRWTVSLLALPNCRWLFLVTYRTGMLFYVLHM